MAVGGSTHEFGLASPQISRAKCGFRSTRRHTTRKKDLCFCTRRSFRPGLRPTRKHFSCNWEGVRKGTLHGKDLCFWGARVARPPRGRHQPAPSVPPAELTQLGSGQARARPSERAAASERGSSNSLYTLYTSPYCPTTIHF